MDDYQVETRLRIISAGVAHGSMQLRTIASGPRGIGECPMAPMEEFRHDFLSTHHETRLLQAEGRANQITRMRRLLHHRPTPVGR
jgi:hypothetical protein